MAKHDVPCWCGGTERACSIYDDHAHCFKCNKQNWKLTKEELELMENNILPNNVAQLKTPAVIERGVVTALDNRGITKEVAEKFRVEKLFNGLNEPLGFAYNQLDPETGEIFAQKIKYLDGGMSWRGDHDKASLFGKHMVPAGGKYITITEGEEDAMAAYQMMKTASGAFEPAVVSIPDGAGSAEKICKKDWEYINSFENIIIAFDGDEVGRKAAEKVCKLFDYKPKILMFSEAKKDKNGAWQWKDSNDYLMGGRVKEFLNMWWRADRMTPKGVLSMKSLWDFMVKKETNTRVAWPWDGMNKMLHGLITGHLVIIKAGVKVGKTSLLKEIAYHIHTTSEHNVGIIFLENTKKEIGLGLCALHMNKPMKPWEIPDDIEGLAKAHAFMSDKDRITIFDPEDTRTAENILAKITYFVKAHDCRFILLDHISMLAYQSGDDNERRFLDKLLADLKELTTSFDINIAAVIHVNDDGKTRGSRAPGQLCDVMINLERDKTSDDPIIKNTTTILVEEHRWGECGTACRLFYDQKTGRMTEMDDVGPMMDREVKFDD